MRDEISTERRILVPPVARSAALSPDAVLGPALAAAIRQLVREELAARTTVLASPQRARPELISPEEAARRFGGRPSADTIRSLIHRGRIQRRVASDGDAKRASYLVTTEEVLAALEASGKPVPTTAEPVDLEAARARARERAGKGKGR